MCLSLFLETKEQKNNKPSGIWNFCGGKKKKEYLPLFIAVT